MAVIGADWAMIDRKWNSCMWSLIKVHGLLFNMFCDDHWLVARWPYTYSAYTYLSVSGKIM